MNKPIPDATTLTRCVEERKLESMGLRITPGFAELLVTFKLTDL